MFSQTVEVSSFVFRIFVCKLRNFIPVMTEYLAKALMWLAVCKCGSRHAKGTAEAGTASVLTAGA